MQRTIVAALAAGILASAGIGLANAQTPSRQNRTQDQTQQGNLYGWQLMTPAEREQYRQQMRQMSSPEARERFRAEHHRQMQERARERGVTLPDEPGQGMGRGRGTGPGMGPGSGPRNGMGPGTGRGRGMGPGSNQ
ncbi:MAG TPA: hypothetical protein VKA13_00895 [Gammaproteobacteria bacterium]|nr:hypothetical protein [Gammaproteobacteria bacterium]